jgi:hypothetical protein
MSNHERARLDSQSMGEKLTDVFQKIKNEILVKGKVHTNYTDGPKEVLLAFRKHSSDTIHLDKTINIAGSPPQMYYFEIPISACA